MVSVSNFSLVNRFVCSVGIKPVPQVQWTTPSAQFFWTVRASGLGRKFATFRSTPRFPNCARPSSTLHWMGFQCQFSADLWLMQSGLNEFWSCAQIFEVLAFARLLARLLLVECLGLWSQSSVPSFPRPPRVSPYWYHADESRRVGPARLFLEYFWVVAVVIIKLSATESL